MRARGIVALAVLLGVASGGCRVRIGDGDQPWAEQVDGARADLVRGEGVVHYVDLGQGEPVVMVHGFADSGYTWHENVGPLLDAGYRVVLVDLPGMGRSSVPEGDVDFTMEELASAVLSVADHLALERFSLVGNSMGGGIGLYLALEHPQRVRGVVVTDPAAFVPEGHRGPRPTRAAARAAAPLASRALVRSTLRDVYHDDALVDDVLIDEYARPLHKRDYVYALLSMQASYFSEEFVSMTGRYEELSPPLLVVWGERDTWLPVVWGEQLEERIPGARLEIIEDSGHVPHQESPEVFNPLLLEFLETVLLMDRHFKAHPSSHPSRP